jgi:hypothetical protein
MVSNELVTARLAGEIGGCESNGVPEFGGARWITMHDIKRDDAQLSPVTRAQEVMIC